MYNTQNYWVFGLCPLSVILKTVFSFLEYRTMDTVREPSNSATYLVCPIIDREDTIMGIINLVMGSATMFPNREANFPRGDKQKLFLLTALDSRTLIIQDRRHILKCFQIS
jgi:hypothetical protein